MNRMLRVHGDKLYEETEVRRHETGGSAAAAEAACLIGYETLKFHARRKR